VAAQRKSFWPDQQPESHYDFKTFLANDDTKKQLCQLMLRVWSSSSAVSCLERTEMAMLIVEGRAHQLVTLNGQVS